MGQAKRAKNGAVSSGGIKWKAIMQWLSFAYLTYLMAGYSLICPHGYIEYDMLKSRMFWIPTLVFVFCELVLWAISLDNQDHFRFGYREKKDKIDFVMYALFIVWGISTLVSSDRRSAFFGDNYRYQGFLFFGLALAGMFLLSHIGGWNKISTAIIMVVLPVIYVWQMLNYFGIVPFNWQMDRQYPLLVSCLANIDQNSAFDGVAIAAGTAAFVFCKNKLIKILWGFINVLCVMGAITTRSDSFYLGIAIGAVIIVGFSFKHAEYIRSTAVAMALYLVGIIAISLLESQYAYRAIFRFSYDSGGATLITSGPVIKLLALAVIVFGVVAVFYPMLPKKITNAVHLLYIIAVAGGGVAATVYFVKLYFSDSQSEVALFVREIFASRAPIWKYSFINMGYQNLTHQLFGVGFGNFNRVMDRYSSVVYTIRDYAELADAHNIVIDLFVATGILGAGLWIGLLACVVVKCRRAASRYPWALIGVMLVAGVLATGFANTSLIIVTPWVYMGIGLILYQVNLNDVPLVGASADEKPSEKEPPSVEEADGKTPETPAAPDFEKMEWAEVKTKKNSKGKKSKKGKN